MLPLIRRRFHQAQRAILAALKASVEGSGPGAPAGTTTLGSLRSAGARDLPFRQK
jgi:hypothetical protein